MADDRGRFLNDGGSLTNRTSNFYVRKEIQRSYNFMVYFDESDSVFRGMESFHAISVELPNYGFRKEDAIIGPFTKTFPVLDHNGFEFTMKLEEDDNGSVNNLIQKLIRKNIDEDGFLRHYTQTVLDNIVVTVYQSDADNVRKVKFKNCYFMKASTAQYSYEDSKQITYDLTFNADHYYEIGRQGALNQMGI